MSCSGILRTVFGTPHLFFALFISFLFLSSSALAHHKPEHGAYVAGEIGYSKNPLCDTKEHADSIVQANIDSGSYDVSRQRFLELFGVRSKEKGHENEQACAIPPPGRVWKVIVLEEVSVFENVPLQGGRKTVYILKVKHLNLNITYFLLSLAGVEQPE